MDSRLFWKSIVVQAAFVGVLFAILIALPLPDDFFEDYGWITGPVAWFGCSVLTARVLDIPVGYVALLRDRRRGLRGDRARRRQPLGGHGGGAARVRRLERDL